MYTLHIEEVFFLRIHIEEVDMNKKPNVIYTHSPILKKLII